MKKFLIIFTVVTSLFLVRSYGQGQRPTANVDDLWRHIGQCEVKGDMQERYIQQLEAKITELQKPPAVVPEKK